MPTGHAQGAGWHGEGLARHRDHHIGIKPGCRPWLIYRVHHRRKRGTDQRKGFTENDYARLLDTACQQLAGPLVLVWDNLNCHVSDAMDQLIAAGTG